jgi:hypothetical protein
MWRLLAVVALLVLAGCTGLLDEQRTERVTAAPVPDVDPSLVEVPTANGSVDVAALLRRHEAALSNRSFTRSVGRAGPENTRTVWVDREADIVRVRRTFGPLTDDAVAADGMVYRLASDDPDADYRAEPSNDTVPYVPSLSGRDRLGQVLFEDGYRRVDTVERNGRPVAVLAVNATGRGAGTDPSVAVQSELHVDADGVVRSVDHWERRPDGTVVEFRMTVETGTGSVPVPWWAEDIGLYG